MKTIPCPSCGKKIVEGLSRCPFCDFSEDELSTADLSPEVSGEVPASRVAKVGLRRGAAGRSSSSRMTYLLPILFLFLFIFLFLGWRIATSPPKDHTRSKDSAPSPNRSNQTDDETKDADTPWAEKTKHWQQLLKRSGDVLSANESRNEEGADTTPQDLASAQQKPIDGTRRIDIVSIDASIKSGDLVDIVWSSPDGSVWKKVVAQPVNVHGVSRGNALVTVTPEQAKAIGLARSKGQVFVAPR